MKRIDQPALDTAHAQLPQSPALMCLIAECVDDRHLVMAGRVLVRWGGVGEQHERWFATLQGLPVRRGDRVLMVRPENSEDYVVTGVVDGFAKRPYQQKSEAGRVELKRDEVVRIAGADGRDLIELSQGESGPVVKLLHDDLELHAAGTLTLRAKELRLEAEQGQVQVKATDDVVIRGEVVRLN